VSAPYMPLYVADYLGDTQHLSIEQSGCYLHLLMAMWRAGGSLPADPSKLARMVRLTPARWAKIGPDVLAFFVVVGDQLTNARLGLELEKYQRTSDARSVSGKRGARVKSLKSNTLGQANASSLLKPGLSISEPEPEEEDPHIEGAGAQSDLAVQVREVMQAAGDAVADPARCAGIASIAPLRGLLSGDSPCDWQLDVLPAVQSAAAWHRSRDGSGGMTSWTTARKIAVQNRNARLAGAPEPQIIEIGHARRSNPAPSAKRQAHEANMARALAAAQSLVGDRR
jgi:uncharacterized protein YdaU (DUF1376 family)